MGLSVFNRSRLLSGRSIPAILEKGWRLPEIGPQPTFWPLLSAFELSWRSCVILHAEVLLWAFTEAQGLLEMTQWPPWTHLVLISLYHVLRLCHSFKGCALLSSFQFYVQYLIFFQLNHSHQHPKALNSKRNPLSSHPTNYHSILYFPLFMVSQKSHLPTLVSISSMLRSCSNLAARFKHPFWKTEWAFSFLVFILPDISPVFASVTPNLLL